MDAVALKNKRIKTLRMVIKKLKKNYLRDTTDCTIPDGSKIPHVLSTGRKFVSPG